MIKPIETVYKGYRFRSRLEARWAVFFDNVMVKYEYEPEGFILDDGTLYLPDFYLPDIDAYIEIKPVGAINISFNDGMVKFSNGRENAEKYAKAMAAIAKEHTYIIFEGDPLNALLQQEDGCGHAFFMGVCVPGILSYDDPTITCTNGKRCVDCDQRGIDFLNSLDIVGFTSMSIIAIYFGKSLDAAPVDFKKFDIFLYDAENERRKMPVGMSEYEFKSFIEVNLSAMKEARQARFEYGETPA